MSLERVLSLCGAVALAAFGLAFMVELSNRADEAYHQQIAAEKAGVALAQQLTVDRSPARLVVYFDRGVRPDCLGPGWSDIRPDPGNGIGSAAPVAMLNLVGVPKKDTIAVLTMERMYVAGRASQRVRVTAGGRRLGEWVVTEQAPQMLRFAVPAQAVSATGDLALRLEFPDAGEPNPRVATTRYRRHVAMRLKRIEVVAPAT